MDGYLCDADGCVSRLRRPSSFTDVFLMTDVLGPLFYDICSAASFSGCKIISLPNGFLCWKRRCGPAILKHCPYLFQGMITLGILLHCGLPPKRNLSHAQNLIQTVSSRRDSTPSDMQYR